MSKMDCVKVAFQQAGYDSSHLPDAGVKTENMSGVCQEFGTQYHSNCRVSVGEEPVIIVYENDRGNGHAVYHQSPADIDPTGKVIGVVTGLKR